MHPVGAAHHGHQMADDGKPQASALVTPGRGDIGLGKAVENGLDLVPGDADAGIPNDEPEMAIPDRPFLGVGQQPVGLDGQDHTARVRELDRVADQIDEDLAQAARVAHELARDVFPVPNFQDQAFLDGQGPKDAHDLFHGFGQVERRFGQFQSPSLDAGIVDDVIEHREQ